MRGKRILFFLITIVIGLAAGLFYGWVLNPVKFEDTAPAMLHQDYKTDYVLMVAEIYNADFNLEQASRRLALLDSLPPSRIVQDAILSAGELGYSARDQELMGKLALALQNANPTPTPTTGGQP